MLGGDVQNPYELIGFGDTQHPCEFIGFSAKVVPKLIFHSKTHFPMFFLVELSTFVLPLALLLPLAHFHRFLCSI